MLKRKNLTYWVLGLAMATVFFAALKATQYFRYENSDDILFVKSFMGYEGGVSASFNLYTHTVLARPLQWLSGLFPEIAWFSVCQIVFMWFGLSVICKSAVSCAVRSGLPVLVGILSSGLFLLTFTVFPSCRISYTTTSAVLGAAATAQLFSIPFHQQRSAPIIRGILLSVFLLICGYCLRQLSILSYLPFWFLAFAALWLHSAFTRPVASESSKKFQNNKNNKPILLSLAIGLAAFLLLIELRAFEINTLQQNEFLGWQSARINLMDYHEAAFDIVTDESLESIGWSRAELELVREWYFMDENISASALTQLADIHAQASHADWGTRLGIAFHALLTFYQARPGYQLFSLLIIALCGLCLLFCFGHRKKEWIFALLAIASVCVAFLLQLYLALQGRILPRAMDCILFPCAALLFALAISCFRWIPSNKTYTACVLAVTVLSLVLSAFSFRDVNRQLQTRPDTVSPTRQATLESFGLAHGDQLILYSPNLLRDTRLFPDVSAGIPTNLMIWGDWYCRTPSWLYQLSTFGIDGTAFAPQDFLRENLLFATADDEPPAALLTYLTESLGPIAYQQYDESGDLRFFQFIPKEGSSYGQ